MADERLYQIALTLLDGIGDINAKALLAYCGSPSAVFRQSKTKLLKIPGIGEKLAGQVAAGKTVLKRAEQEMHFIEKYRIRTFFFTDEGYPARLKLCDDGPVMLYYKGNVSLNHPRIVAVVGTRKPSEYARQKTAELVRELKEAGILVLSGLAYGVDAIAHRTAIDCGMPTVGVLGHGLDIIYPSSHDTLAKKMIRCGGLLTDYLSGTKPDAMNFPKRNRVVAGLCDAIVVIESKRTGGSLITATIASSYNRDVFAFPGRAGDPLAEGCNGLIKRNKAALIESADDFLEAMMWKPDRSKTVSEPGTQLPLPLSLSDDEMRVMRLFSERNLLHVDEIALGTKMSQGKVSTVLLQLEFANLLKSRPGKIYCVS